MKLPPDQDPAATEQVPDGIRPVVNLDAVQTFKVTALLGRTRYGSPPRGIVPSVPVEVAGKAPRRVIGHANVYQCEKQILADLYLIRDCPERLDIETKTRKLYANFGYRLDPFVIVHIFLTPVQPPWDPPPLGEPIL
jgi:hypothetical protein